MHLAGQVRALLRDGLAGGEPGLLLASAPQLVEARRQPGEQLRADGMTVMSLSGSPLARHDAVDDGDRSSIERGLDVLSALLEPAYGFRSLATFKKKFQPEFSPLWMVSPDPALLPAIGVALVRCYIPGLTLRGAVQLTAALRRSRETTSA